jgi:hypothetical protein
VSLPPWSVLHEHRRTLEKRWHRDAGHVTPFSPWELGGFLVAAGFGEVELHRQWNGSAFQRVVRPCLLGWIHRITGTDWCASVIAVAKRPEE